MIEWLGRRTGNPEVAESRSDHKAGVVSRKILVQHLGRACK